MNKYYKKQIKAIYKLDEDKIKKEFDTMSNFSREIGVSRAVLSYSRNGSYKITETSKHFEKLKDYLIPTDELWEYGDNNTGDKNGI